jgi:N-methylhydantoinase B
MIDVEVVEAWYPILVKRRGPRPGLNGAGTFRSGAGMSMEYIVRGTDALSMTLMGNRERVPIAGLGGGLPGAVTEFQIRRRDGALEPLACHQQGIPLQEGEGVLIDCASGGGWGDPLDREPAMVEADVTDLRLSAEDAREIYGVILGDVSGTTSLRAQKLRERLDRAQPAAKPLTWTADLRLAAQGVQAPLYIGVNQHGAVAVSARTGAPLAVSPESWTEGCPTIEHFVASSSDVNIVAYLDPGSGHLLAVDVRLEGGGRSFDTAPKRWTEARAA